MSENSPYSDRLRLIKLGLLPKEAVAKKKQPIKKVSDKKKQQIEAEKKERGDGETELTKWFRGRMKQMVGRCKCCGEKTETKKYEFAIGSIAHILPKRNNQFPSAKYHPLNFIELCYPCHQNFDNFWSWDDKANLDCWPEIIEKLIMIEPILTQEERNKLPEFVLSTIQKKYPF